MSPLQDMLHLRNVSAVLLANQHNPSIINPEFLRGNQIAGADWTVKSTLSTPPLSKTVFENGVSFQVDNGRCVISQEIKGPLQEQYEAFRATEQYALTLKHIPYHAAGLNWHLHFPVAGGKTWLATKFLRSRAWPAVDKSLHTLQLQFKFQLQDGFCTYSITEEKIGTNGGRQDIISAGCNFHFDLSGNQERKIEQITSIMQSWPERQRLLLETLTPLLAP